MPPKDKGPGKKAVQKAQNKVIDDKTFGLKNKNKSKQVQKFCQGVEQQVKKGNVSNARLIEQEHQKKADKKKAEEEAALMASLFKTVDAAKQKGGNFTNEAQGPKVCEYFKMGMCQKGRKCKLSHDIQKSENIDLYTDQRQQLDQVGEEDEDMTNWDEEKLKSVIDQQQKKFKGQVQSDILLKKKDMDENGFVQMV